MWKKLQEADGAFAEYAPTEQESGSEDFQKEQGVESESPTVQADSVPCAVLFIHGLQSGRPSKKEAWFHFRQSSL